MLLKIKISLVVKLITSGKPIKIGFLHFFSRKLDDIDLMSDNKGFNEVNKQN